MILKVVIYRNVAFTHLNTQIYNNKAKTKTCYLPGHGPLIIINDLVFESKHYYIIVDPPPTPVSTDVDLFECSL